MNFGILEEEVAKQIDVVPSSEAKNMRAKRPKCWQALFESEQEVLAPVY